MTESNTGKAPGIRLDDAGGVTLFGDMTFESVPILYEQFIQLDLNDQPFDHVNLAGVDHADSAGLALLLEWKSQHGQRSGVSGQSNASDFRVVNAPEGLIRLANLCDAVELLQMSGTSQNS